MARLETGEAAQLTVKLSFVPLFVFLFAIGLVIGVVAGGLGGVFLWPNPPCPACPVYVEPTPVSCPTPRPVACDCVCPTPLPQTDESPESAFYRGWLGSCINNGQLAGSPRETTIKWCRSHLQYGIKGDWFDGFRPDNWSWPPPFLEEGDTQPKSDAGP